MKLKIQKSKNQLPLLYMDTFSQAGQGKVGLSLICNLSSLDRNDPVREVPAKYKVGGNFFLFRQEHFPP
jgi:hypothetical protein